MGALETAVDRPDHDTAIQQARRARQLYLDARARYEAALRRRRRAGGEAGADLAEAEAELERCGQTMEAAHRRVADTRRR